MQLSVFSSSQTATIFVVALFGLIQTYARSANLLARQRDALPVAASPVAARILLPASSSSSLSDALDVLTIDKLFNASECPHNDRVHGCVYSRCLFEGLECEAENSACQRVNVFGKGSVPRILRCQCLENFHYALATSCVNSSTYYLMQAEVSKDESEQTEVENVLTSSSTAETPVFVTAPSETTPSAFTLQPKCGKSPGGTDPFGLANQAHLLNWPSMTKRGFVANFTDENLIVGGQDVEPGVICWQAGIQISHDNDAKHQFCGGTILSEKWVMTAGHCVVNGDTITPDTIASARNLFVTTGSMTNALNTQPQQRTFSPSPCLEQKFRVSQIIVHPDYKVLRSTSTKNFVGIHNDIALLELSHPIDFSSPCACTMCLAGDRQPIDDEIGIISGFGCQKPDCSDARSAAQPANLLKFARASFVPDQSVSCFGTKNGQMARDYMCVGGEFGTDACPGDSGGPFVLYDRKYGVHYQAGIASFVVGDADSYCGLGNPARYTDVSKYVPFIQQYVKDVEVLM